MSRGRRHSLRTAPFELVLRRPPANDAPAIEAPRDPFVARAIAAMTAEPARRWTVASLARAAGLSRAAFARHFARATGTSPLRWLTEHRLGLAQVRLLASDLPLAAIAVEVGYATEFAFGKAFKRLLGVSPGLFRSTVRASLGSHASFGVPRCRAAA